MGSMKRKRRKKLAREWAEFQAKHGLFDDDMKLARATGYPLKLLQEKLSDSTFDEEPSVAARIHEIHRRWQEQLAARKAAIEAGLIESPAKKKKKKPAASHDPQWVKAKKLCRLNMEDIRKAKELGISPRTLIKNIPDPTQRWKAPVKIWIRDMYEEHQQRSSRKSRSAAQPMVRNQALQMDHD